MEKYTLCGKFIGVKSRVNTFTVNKTFYVEKLNQARLHITALGLYFVKINEVRVGDAYLTPGWSEYNNMLQVQEYDVQPYLKFGENIIEITVNEGWYSGPLAWMQKRNCFGDQPAVCADLVWDEDIVSTNESWAAHTSSIKSAGIYAGERIDFTEKDESLEIQEVPFDKSVLVKQISEYVKTTERFPVKKVIRTSQGELVYDFGQNIAGVVEIVTPENFDGTLTMSHAEILVNGEFYTKNLGGAKATDILTCQGKVTYSPEFTYHGFRYMKLEGGELPAENVTALARHSDMKRTGWVETSNPKINHLISNILWGQRSNFVDIPTDCPQRSERLGWTGDINVFCSTAAFNYDIHNFMKKWLADFRSVQRQDGSMLRVVPWVAGEVLQETDVSALWADSIVNIPYELYHIYGDKTFLSENYEAIKKFIKSHDKNFKDGLIQEGFEFGDWLALDGEKLAGTDTEGRTDKYFIANVMYLGTLEKATKIATILGYAEDAANYSTLRENLLKAVRCEYFTASGRLAVETVTAKVLALCFGAVPDEHRVILAHQLNEQVKKYRYCPITGFVGTPYLLFALADNGYFDTASRVLLNTGYPGWLYEVDMGATTIWERWNTLLPDGTPNPNGMNSCNHYAYGSILAFIFRKIAGLQNSSAGYAKIKIAPNPCKGIARIEAKYRSVQGMIVSGYEQKNGKITFFAEIPQGAEAEILLPNEQSVYVQSGKYEFVRDWENLEIHYFDENSSLAKIHSNPKSKQAFLGVFGKYFIPLELAYLASCPDKLYFIYDYLGARNRMTKEEFADNLNKFNELYLTL